MNERFHRRGQVLVWVGLFWLPLLLFWIVLTARIPADFSQELHAQSFALFLIILLLYSIAFRFPGRLGIWVSLSLTMILLSLTLSYLWTSGFSDNFIIGGLLPYKDAKNFYFGANLILNGNPVSGAQQASERPLFPAFLASVLFLTRENLKIAIAVIVQLMGLGLFLTARQIRNLFGALAAGLYATLIYFYILSLIGYTVSETLGFAAGCFAFGVILLAAFHLKQTDLILGLVTLLVAVSARAGTFIIFPLLVIWVGWALRKDTRFSWKAAGSVFLIILVGYFLINSVFSRLLGVPAGASFRNFSYALYGQVRGGLGWHSAINELGTRDPMIVYRATIHYFLEHPTHAFIGFAKSYRDFFLPGPRGIFSFLWHTGQYQLSTVLCWVALALVVRGVALLLRDIHSSVSSLLLAGFMGVFLSIPFLPPIDGDTRFYASTTPFIFVVAAVGISGFSKGLHNKIPSFEDSRTERLISRFFAFFVLALTLIVPLTIYMSRPRSAHQLPVCSPKQEPFVMEHHSGMYIDLVKDGSAPCGFLPEVCLKDFRKNNLEKSVDDFYQKLLTLTKNSSEAVRLMAGFDLVAEKIRYYYVTRDKLPAGPLPKVISGCAVMISTKNQTIFQVESILLK